MKHITIDITVEAIRKFVARNYSKSTKVEILSTTLCNDHTVSVAAVKHSREKTLKYYVFEYVMCQCTELPVNLLQFAVSKNDVLQYHTIGFTSEEDAVETAKQIVKKLEEN